VEEVLVVVIYCLDGQEYYVVYVILVIQKLIRKQLIYVMIVEKDFNKMEYAYEKKNKNKDVGIFYEAWK